MLRHESFSILVRFEISHLVYLDDVGEALTAFSLWLSIEIKTRVKTCDREMKEHV